MEKKNPGRVFTTFGVIFGVLAAVAFVLLPQIASWFSLGNIETLIPVKDLINPVKVFDFTNFSISFGDNNWIKLAFLGGLALFALLLIIWLFVLLFKKPSQILHWFFVVIVICLSAEIFFCVALNNYSDVREGGIVTYELQNQLEDGIIHNNLLNVFCSMVFGEVSSEFNPILGYIGYGIAAAAALSAFFALLGIFASLSWLGKYEKEDNEDEEEYIEQPEQPVEEPEELQPEQPEVEGTDDEVEPEEVVEQPEVEEIEQPQPEPIAEPQPEPEAVIENPRKMVRRILVHKTGRVIRVLNEHYYDVTTNIYVEPGFDKPLDPTETEQVHFEKLLAAQTGIAPKQETPVAPKPAPVVTPVVQPEPTVELEPEEPAEEETQLNEEPIEQPVKDENGEEQYERISFIQRIKTVDQYLKDIYNELKSEILSYGVKSRVASGGDTFRLHTKTYVKMTVAGKSIKLYLALDPKEYMNSTLPVGDASGKNMYKEFPLVFKVKSELSLRRAKALIADTMAKDRLIKGDVERRDWVAEI